MEVSKQQLKTLLAHVGDQVSGVQSDSVILQMNSFAQYIREQNWTKYEYNKELSKIVHWLGTDPDIPIKTIAQFVLNHSSEEHDLMQMIKSLEKNNPERIFHVGMYIYLRLSVGMPQSTIYFFTYPAQQGNIKAMYLMTQLPIRNLYEGEKWAVKYHTKLIEENTSLEKLFQNDPILTSYFEEKSQFLKDKDGEEYSDILVSLGHELLQWFRYDDAIYWLQKAAKQHHPGAMTVLGRSLIDRGETEQQVREGQQWLQKAAEAGSTTAMGLLGTYLISGIELPKNIEEGKKWLCKAAENGDSLIMSILGVELIEGENLPRNVEEGEKWLRKAAECGDPFAMGKLGIYLLEGKHLPMNKKEGQKWLYIAGELLFYLDKGFGFK